MVPLLLLIAAIGAGARRDRGRGRARHARPPAREPGLPPAGRPREARRARGRDGRLSIVLWIALSLGARALGHEGLGLGILAAATDRRPASSRSTFGCVALLVGAATGHRGAATAFAAASPSPRTSSTRWPRSSASSIDGSSGSSPFYHYSATNALHAGLAADHLGFLLLVGTLAAIAAVVRFDRRDLATP